MGPFLITFLLDLYISKEANHTHKCIKAYCSRYIAKAESAPQFYADVVAQAARCIFWLIMCAFLYQVACFSRCASEESTPVPLHEWRWNAKKEPARGASKSLFFEQKGKMRAHCCCTCTHSISCCILRSLQHSPFLPSEQQAQQI